MLYKLMELSDLYADACIRDESGQLMFLSLYGRDTAIQQFLAALSLKENSGGFNAFRLSSVDDHGVTAIEKVFVASADRLEKLSGRLPKENLFGNLVHTWIYDPVLLQPDRPNKTGWYMLGKEFTSEVRSDVLQGIWGLYKTLSPVPLLDEWMEVVIRATQSDCVSFMDDCNYPPIGSVTAARVTLPDTFPELISNMIKSRMIGLNGEQARCIAEAHARLAEVVA
jgi:hypothetical protein